MLNMYYSCLIVQAIIYYFRFTIPGGRQPLITPAAQLRYSECFIVMLYTVMKGVQYEIYMYPIQ